MNIRTLAIHVTPANGDLILIARDYDALFYRYRVLIIWPQYHKDDTPKHLNHSFKTRKEVFTYFRAVTGRRKVKS